MDKVLITGGSGLIGMHLIPRLKEQGFEVALLGRNRSQYHGVKSYMWNVEKQEIESEALNNIDHIIHLAGANIGDKRWSTKRKNILVDSRVKSGQFLFDQIQKKNLRLKSFISASAIGYYGAITSDKIFIESDPPADDFLGRLCSLWEKSAENFSKTGIRTVKIRTGVVLTSKGGALAKMVKPIRSGFGSPLGSGKQYIPWIHIDDLCNIYLKAITDIDMNGAYNAVSPCSQTNMEFTESIARLLNKKIRFPNVPSWFIKTIFGEMSDIILKGSRVSADKIISTGFIFKYNDLDKAFIDLL